jgi:hypothetical protein
MNEQSEFEFRDDDDRRLIDIFVDDEPEDELIDWDTLPIMIEDDER